MAGMIPDWFPSLLKEEEDLHRNPLNGLLICAVFQKAMLLQIMQCWNTAYVKILN